MENSKDKTSKSGSKSDLNESSLPLLEGDDADIKTFEGKVAIEMDTRCSDENSKDESGKEIDGKDAATEENSSKKDKKKEKKEKKEKKKEEKGHNRAASLADRLTAGLNLLDRDDRNVNDHVNIVFEDVLAEPDANHGFDATWRLAFIVFSGTKLWMYRVISAILAIPCGLTWGIVFALLTLLNVWLVSPLLRTFSVLMHITHKLWASVVHTFLDPVFQSVGQLFSSIKIKNTSFNQDTVKEP